MYNIARKLLVVGAVALSPASANAATVTATYSGTVGAGIDLYDQFEYGYDLAGAVFTMVYVYDTTVGQYSDDPDADQIRGGYQLAPFFTGFDESPMLSSVLEINGIAVSYQSNAYAHVTAFNNGTESYISHFAGNIYDGADYVWLTERLLTDAIPADLNVSFDVVGSGKLSPFERIEQQPLLELYNFDQGSFRVNSDTALGSLRVERLSITVSSVPLPGALPLFMVALLGLGMLRRRPG